MSFRRKGKAAKTWRDWVERHADALAQCGLPEVVYQDERAWENFLAEGFLPAGSGVYSGWKVELLSAEQGRRFYDFLDWECAEHPFQQSMMKLLRRVGFAGRDGLCTRGRHLAARCSFAFQGPHPRLTWRSRVLRGASMPTEHKTLYVALMDEGTRVWRPVPAEQVGPGLFRIQGPVPDDETWEFGPGDVVRWAWRLFSGGETQMVAVKRAETMRQVAARPLWIGHAGDLRDPRGILGAGIQAVVELADSEQMAVLPRDLVRCRFPLSDGGLNLPWLLRLAADSVVALLRAHVPTLVCCSGGMSLSVCVAACGVALAEGRSLEEALAVVGGSGPADVSPGLLAEFRAVLQA
jgi:hypothetical protein